MFGPQSNSWQKLSTRAVQLFWYRQLPYGLLSVHYLRRSLSPAVQHHRRLAGAALPVLPRWLFWLCNTLLTCRWLFYYAWRHSFRAVRKFGPAVARSTGTGLFTQYRNVLALALAYTIPPVSYYQYRLYAPGQRERIWHYIYIHELPVFHLMRDRPGASEERLILADKYQFASEMTALGSAIAQGSLLHAGSSIDDLPVTDLWPLFCKPRTANQSYGAFKLELESPRNIRLHTISGITRTGIEAEHFINKHLARQDYLVQPCYQHHPDFSILNPLDNEAVTARIISYREDQRTTTYCAYIEVPHKVSQQKRYFCIQINPSDGILIPESLNRQPLLDPDDYKSLQQAAKHFQMPHWQTALQTIDVAHTRFSKIHAIAWDLILAEDGPVLLEGNSNWQIDLPQQFCGGFLAEKK